MNESGEKQELLRRAYGDCGPEWERAIAYGIDVSVLPERLRMTPEERLLELDQTAAFVSEIRAGLHHGHTAER